MGTLSLTVKNIKSEVRLKNTLNKTNPFIMLFCFLLLWKIQYLISPYPAVCPMELL